MKNIVRETDLTVTCPYCHAGGYRHLKYNLNGLPKTNRIKCVFCKARLEAVVTPAGPDGFQLSVK